MATKRTRKRAHRSDAAARRARRIVHDFNNVLAAILGSADLLQLRLKDGDPAREEVEEIQKAAQRGATLTRQLLALLPPATPGRTDAASD